MRYIYLILSLLICSNSFAQVQRAFINKEGRYSNNPQGAISYILIRKLDGDSAYSVKQYDMRDTIMISGTYKDELLTIPNGKFVYYYKESAVKIAEMYFSREKVDTNNFIQTVGYFLNGKKEGLWISYSSRGKIGQECTFQNGKLNGPYTVFYDDEITYWGEGTMVNDQLEGKYYVYNGDSVLVAESDYVHNKKVKHIDHLQEAKEDKKFIGYLERSLTKYKKELIANLPLVKFVVTKTGLLKNVEIVKGITPEVDAALITALIKAPAFTPAKYDGMIAEQKITRPILLFHEDRVGPDGQRPLPQQVHYKERLEGLIPQDQAGGTYKPGVNYLH